MRSPFLVCLISHLCFCLLGVWSQTVETLEPADWIAVFGHIIRSIVLSASWWRRPARLPSLPHQWIFFHAWEALIDRVQRIIPRWFSKKEVVSGVRGRAVCWTPASAPVCPASLGGKTTVLGRGPFQPPPSFLRSLTSMLISGNFPGGLCDVETPPLRNGPEPQTHLK